MNSPKTNKSLGQHWLNDLDILETICNHADVDENDTVLEIGPGPGTLTKVLVNRAKKVIAVELDPKLARDLSRKIKSENLEVINSDILKFDFGSLPKNYKIVANIPYFLTSHLMRVISETHNRPIISSILVQKEVAERICAKAGDTSLLSISTQFYYETVLGLVVKPEMFTPPPKVDSQVVILTRKDKLLIPQSGTKEFFRVVKAGFSERRKKLRSSLSGGLGITKEQVDRLLIDSNINPNARAQELALKQWLAICKQYYRQI